MVCCGVMWCDVVGVVILYVVWCDVCDVKCCVEL